MERKTEHDEQIKSVRSRFSSVFERTAADFCNVERALPRLCSMTMIESCIVQQSSVEASAPISIRFDSNMEYTVEHNHTIRPACIEIPHGIDDPRNNTTRCSTSSSPDHCTQRTAVTDEESVDSRRPVPPIHHSVAHSTPHRQTTSWEWPADTRSWWWSPRDASLLLAVVMLGTRRRWSCGWRWWTAARPCYSGWWSATEECCRQLDEQIARWGEAKQWRGRSYRGWWCIDWMPAVVSRGDCRWWERHRDQDEWDKSDSGIWGGARYVLVLVPKVESSILWMSATIGRWCISK